MIDTIGWIGNIFFLISAVLLARKIKHGFLCNVLGNASYLIFGILVAKHSITILSGMLILTNIYGFIHWSKNEKVNNTSR